MYPLERVDLSQIISYPHFKLILEEFATALLDVSFGIISHNLSGTNHLKKYLEKHFCARTLINTNLTSFSLFTELFSFTF